MGRARLSRTQLAAGRDRRRCTCRTARRARRHDGDPTLRGAAEIHRRRRGGHPATSGRVTMTPRILPGTDLVVSPLCLGGTVYGNTITEPESFALLDRYVELGGNFLDT